MTFLSFNCIRKKSLVFLDGGFQGISKFMTAVDFDRLVRPSRNQQAKEKNKNKIKSGGIDSLIPNFFFFLVFRFADLNYKIIYLLCAFEASGRVVFFFSSSQQTRTQRRRRYSTLRGIECVQINWPYFFSFYRSAR